MVRSWMRSIAFWFLVLFSPALGANVGNAGTWKNICQKHPYLSNAKKFPGIVKAFNPKDRSTFDTAPSCTMKFDYEYGEGQQVQFCESRFYDSVVKAIVDSSAKTVTCTYEAFDYCENEDIAILGKCYRLKTEPKSLKDAKKTCEKEKMTFANFEDQPALEWLLKLHDPNPEHTVSDVWLDSNIEKFAKVDREEKEPTSKETSSVLQFRYSAHGSPGKYRAVDPNEKHAYYCTSPAKRYMAAFKNFCDTVRDHFKIPAAYHKATCFMLSNSVHVPTFIAKTKKIDNKHYHSQCKYVEGMNTYAAAPTSLMKFEGMKRAALSGNKPALGMAARIITPGHSTDTAGSLHETCSLVPGGRKWLNNFFYIGDDMKEYSVHTSGWDADALRSDCADLHRDIIALAPHSGNKIGGSKWPKGDDRHFTAYDYPRFFRGPIVCAAGFHQSDIYSTKCKKDWQAMPRDDGTMMCHKVIADVTDKDKDDVVKKCKQEGGKYLSPVDSAVEQARFFDAVKKVFKEKWSESQYGSAFLGLHSEPWGFDFLNDYDNSPVYYSNWESGGPDNGRGIEHCAATIINPANGRWNDQFCSADGKWKHTARYRIRAALCAYPAE